MGMAMTQDCLWESHSYYPQFHFDEWDFVMFFERSEWCAQPSTQQKWKNWSKIICRPHFPFIAFFKGSINLRTQSSPVDNVLSSNQPESYLKINKNMLIAI